MHISGNTFAHTHRVCTCFPLRSEYINGDIPAGQVVEGIRHEDLQRTTFQDETFDLILSSDVRVPRWLVTLLLWALPALDACCCTGWLVSLPASPSQPNKLRATHPPPLAADVPHSAAVPGLPRAAPHPEARGRPRLHRALLAGAVPLPVLVLWRLLGLARCATQAVQLCALSCGHG